MRLVDVLVHAGTDEGAKDRLRVAADLAAAHGAHVTGVHVMVPRITLPGYVELQLPPGFEERERAWVLDQVSQARALFDGEVRRAGLQSEWRAVEGDLTATILLHARYADLAVVSQGLDLSDPTRQLETLPADLALGVGRPVLVVPRYGRPGSLGDRVLVAWNGSPEATRAVHDALPILQRATAVTVLSIDPRGAEGYRVPGADLALHLARHSVTVQAAQTHAGDLEVGDVLLSYAADMGADLLVMGAYGHSRLRERVLGGASRSLLEHMTLPVLLSH